MAITAVLSVNENKARQLSCGALKVFLSERVPGKDNNAPTSARKGRKKGNQKSRSNPGASNVNSCIDLVDDDIEEPVADAIESTSSHEQVMLVMLQQLNNAFRERLAGVKRAVFNTVVQRGLASSAPRTIEELEKITVSGFSVTMKKKYGKYLVQAVSQVDAFIEKHSTNLDTVLDSFQLDVDSILGPRIMTASEINQTEPTPPRQGGLDWGESDDDWEIMPSENPDDNDGPWNHVFRSNEF